jgi:hypothetical protein
MAQSIPLERVDGAIDPLPLWLVEVFAEHLRARRVP